jgi:hypothetical protein
MNAKTFFSDRPIAYHPILAKVCGSVTAALFLSQIAYWSDKGHSSDGWIWKTREEMTDETGLSRREQESARRILSDLKILQQARRGVPARMWYQIDWDVLTNLIDALPPTRMAETYQLEGTKRANKQVQNVPTIQRVSEKTTKSTSISLRESRKPELDFVPPPESPDDTGFAALFQDMAERFPNMTPRRAQEIGELWDDYPDLKAHSFAFKQTDKYADGFNLRYYRECLMSYRTKKDKENGNAHRPGNSGTSIAGHGNERGNGTARGDFRAGAAQSPVGYARPEQIPRLPG